MTVIEVTTSRPGALRAWADRLTELGQVADGEWSQTTRRDLLAAAIGIGALAEQFARAELSQEEFKVMLAALYGYLTKQENNRDQALRKFGDEARTYGVEQRIILTDRLIDRVEEAWEARYGPLPAERP